MNILICSDGTPAADDAARLGGMLARATKAQVTLLGIAENSGDEQPLRQVLDRQTDVLRQGGVDLRTAIQTGEPTAQILGETSAKKYDLIVIGSRRKDTGGHFWRSHRTYEIIKAVEPPVLVAIGASERISRILLCSGGKHYIDPAVRLTGTIATPIHAEVTVLHIMAEPPAVYAHLLELEEDVGALLRSDSVLGRNLRVEKRTLEKLGVTVKIRIRHGFIVDQLLEEMQEGNYDLIVSGSSRARGPLRHYIMGDVTERILESAACSVLVARSQPPGPAKGLWQSFARLFR
jgi:nucleotide-binding universal stress UspA family protein